MGSVFYQLQKKIKRAEGLHPEGSHIRALLEEVDEVVEVLQTIPITNKRHDERLEAELYDVAVVALRIIGQMKEKKG